MASSRRSIDSPNSMQVLDYGGRSTSDLRPTSASKKKYLVRENSTSSLEFLPPDDDSAKGWNNSDSRPNSSSINRRSGSRVSDSRPDSGGYRRTPTPTKQVSLQTVRRKDDCDKTLRTESLPEEDRFVVQGGRSSRNRNGLGPMLDKINDMSVKDESSSRHKRSNSKCSSSKPDTEASSNLEGACGGANSESQDYRKKSEKKKSKSKEEPQTADIDDSDAFDTDLEDESEDSSGEEDEPVKAPNELLMEFVTCVMQEDYVNAKKLCQMVLIYEPENPEALKFQSLIDEKIRLEEEMANASSDSEEETDSDEDSDEDSDDDDSEYSSSDEDADDESDDDSDEESDSEDEEDGVEGVDDEESQVDDDNESDVPDSEDGNDSDDEEGEKDAEERQQKGESQPGPSQSMADFV